MKDNLRDTTNGLGSYVALVIMVALVVTGSSVVFTMIASIVLGWMTSHVVYYTIKALGVMYTVTLALYDVMPGDDRHPSNLRDLAMMDAYSSFIYYAVQDKEMLNKR